MSELPRLRTVLLVALIAALLAGAGAWFGGLLGGDVEVPTFDTSSGAGALSVTPPGDTAAGALAGLRVADEDSRVKYDRDAQFGSSWRDPDRNGCDARQDTLARQAVRVLERDRQGCVTRATILDPYTRAQLTGGTGIQIDHVVSLADAWRTGAQQLTQDERRELANTPSNLVATTPRENQTLKRDDAADAYLPPDQGYRCVYVARQIGIKAHYGLWVTRAEHDAMAAVLARCPGITLPMDLQRGRIAR